MCVDKESDWLVGHLSDFGDDSASVRREAGRVHNENAVVANHGDAIAANDAGVGFRCEERNHALGHLNCLIGVLGAFSARAAISKKHKTRIARDTLFSIGGLSSEKLDKS